MSESFDRTYPSLSISLDASRLAQFFLLLQQGVKIRRRVGCTVDAFLRNEMQAAPATIAKIQSLMLDGKPVDDITSCLVHDGSTLALSAAMPGLVGATLRRGGAYSSLRSDITYQETKKAYTPREGWVSVKIFNLLMAEMGAPLFRTRVLVGTANLITLLQARGEELQGLHGMLDGKRVDLGKLDQEKLMEGTKEVFLTVSE